MKKCLRYFVVGLFILVSLELILSSNLYSQDVLDYTVDIDMDGQILTVEAIDIRKIVEEKIVKVTPTPEQEKPNEKEESKKKLSKEEVNRLAKEYGLLDETETNPHLSFLVGDISFWHEQKLSKARYKLEFAARRIILEAADKQNIVIDDQGKLSWAAQQVMANLLKEKKNLANSQSDSQ